MRIGIVVYDTGDQNNFNSIDCFEKIELILLSSEISELCASIRMNLLY